MNAEGSDAGAGSEGTEEEEEKERRLKDKQIKERRQPLFTGGTAHSIWKPLLQISQMSVSYCMNKELKQKKTQAPNKVAELNQTNIEGYRRQRQRERETERERQRETERDREKRGEGRAGKARGREGERWKSKEQRRV